MTFAELRDKAERLLGKPIPKDREGHDVIDVWLARCVQCGFETPFVGNGGYYRMGETRFLKQRCGCGGQLHLTKPE